MSQVQKRPPDLPDFNKPPVTETILSLQFAPIAKMTAVHVGVLWQRFREQFPLVEEHPPLPPISEKFGPAIPSGLDIRIEEGPPIPRVWFMNESKTELIQVQTDRFIHNWRKMQGSEPYPRYEPVRDEFRGEVATFEQFLEDERLGSLAVNQCEVSYINHIEPAGVWERHDQLERVLRNWSHLPDAFLPNAEDVLARIRFVIRDSEGEQPIGRLHVSLQSAWKKVDQSPILVLNLTARGVPLRAGTEGAFAFFDRGREWIVKGFADLTTPAMHKAWERKDA